MPSASIKSACMLVVANDYILEEVYKQRHLIIITVSVHFNGGDSTNIKPIISFVMLKRCP